MKYALVINKLLLAIIAVSLLNLIYLNIELLEPQRVETQLIRQGSYPVPISTKVISYSLYGNEHRYSDGVLENAKLYKIIYPGWIMRVYHDQTVPITVLDKLRDKGVQLVDMTGTTFNNNKMVWRFLPASDLTVKLFCSRDADSRLSLREKSAVNAWINSGKNFHVMRDHPAHSNYAMSGGLWCGTHDAVPDMDHRLKSFTLNQDYLQDMNFLNTVIWPLAKDNVLQHDSFSCNKFGGGIPFPTPRTGWEHVGSVYINKKMRQGDVDILKNANVTERCAEVKPVSDNRSNVERI